MADETIALLAIAGLAIVIALLARYAVAGPGLGETWDRHEARDPVSRMFDRLTVRALHDPDWQWHWEARERQVQTLRQTAMESLRAEIETASGDHQGAMTPTRRSAKRLGPPKKPGERERTAPIGG